MALDTYTALQTAVASWLHRDDVSTSIPDFIALAEEAMSRDLADLPVMWATATVSVTAGQNSLSLPADALGLVYAKVLGSYQQQIPFVSIESLIRTTSPVVATGRPQAIAFRGNTGADGKASAIVYPTADAAYDFEIGYRSAVPALSSGNPTNFILKRAPSIYLYGALIASAPFVVQDDRLPMWEAKYRQAVDAFKSQEWDGVQMLSTEISGIGRVPFDITTG